MFTKLCAGVPQPGGCVHASSSDSSRAGDNGWEFNVLHEDQCVVTFILYTRREAADTSVLYVRVVLGWRVAVGIVTRVRCSQGCLD